MRRNIFAVFTLILFLYSCGQDESSAGGDRDISINGDIAINANITSELRNDIQIVSAIGKKPGLNNPIETIINLQNVSNAEKEILVKGIWLDSRGNNYGGSSTIVKLASNQSQILTAGTRSKNVSAYKLTITSNSLSQDELLANTLVKPEREIAEGYGMTYSETAGDEVIPALPIKGVANNRVFVAKTIVFRHGLEGKWKLEISDYEFDALQGVANARFEKKDIQTIYINFDQEPVAGDKILREMAYGGGYFQLKKSRSSMDTTSWNTSIAYAIEITGWNKGASHPESWLAGTCSSPDIGKASGKLYISFKGSDIGYPNAWVSGAFNDVMIIYCGE